MSAPAVAPPRAPMVDRTGVPFTCPLIDRVLSSLAEVRGEIRRAERCRDDSPDLKAHISNVNIHLWGIEEVLEQIRSANERLRERAIDAIDELDTVKSEVKEEPHA